MKSVFLTLLGILILNCKNETISTEISQKIDSKIEIKAIKNPNSFGEKLSNAAISIIDKDVVYTPDYVVIKYPNGDVPAKTGVCTDVVVRAYRKLGIDLQKEVHEDMKANFSKYPTKWGLKKPDTNIDHRRVPNLEVFFERKGTKLVVTNDPNDYKTGDIVTWMIGDKLPHIGIVTHIKSDSETSEGNPMLVHNVGNGQILEDCLFNYKIVGHFRYGK